MLRWLRTSSTIPKNVYEVRARKDKRGVDLICDSKIVLGGTAALHACRCGGRAIFSVVFRPVGALTLAF